MPGVISLSSRADSDIKQIPDFDYPALCVTGRSLLLGTMIVARVAAQLAHLAVHIFSFIAVDALRMIRLVKNPRSKTMHNNRFIMIASTGLLADRGELFHEMMIIFSYD